MSEMVERVARIIAEYEQGDVAPDWHRHVSCAESVIAAMHDPTDKMREAGAIYQSAGKSAVTDAIGTWQTMIEKALE